MEHRFANPEFPEPAGQTVCSRIRLFRETDENLPSDELSGGLDRHIAECAPCRDHLKRIARGRPDRDAQPLFSTSANDPNPLHPGHSPGGWEFLVRHHRRFMLRVAMKVTGCRATAEDVVQETLLWLGTNPWNFLPSRKDALRKWLKRHTRRIAVTLLRPWRRPLLSLDGYDMRHLAGERPRRRHEIDQETMEAIFHHAKLIVRKRFRPMGWRAFQAVYENGQDPRDAAKDLGISRNSVYIYGCRIFALLQDEVRRLLNQA